MRETRELTIRIEALAAHASATNIEALIRHHPDGSSRDIAKVRCLSGAIRRRGALEEEWKSGRNQRVVCACGCCQEGEDAEERDSSRVDVPSLDWRHNEDEM